MPKYVLREMSDLNRTGERRVMPKLDGVELLDGDGFVGQVVSYNRAFHRSTVLGVLTAMSDTLRRMLSEGRSVKIDGVGTFSLSLGFDDGKSPLMADADDRMTHRRVKVKNLNFKVEPELLNWLARETNFVRAEGGVRRQHPSPYSKEERLARILSYLDEHGHISLRQCMELNGVCRSTASWELNRWSETAESPLQPVGKAPHRVWGKR